MLAEGCSLEEIGRRVGRHPSTVSYWLNHHGLRAVGSDRHSGRGGLTLDQLEPLVESGATIAEIARRVDRSPATVRHWLKYHGLATLRGARLRAGGRRTNNPPKVIHRTCRIHGITPHVHRGDRYRCRRCASEHVTRYRQNVKLTLVREAGGCCVICGYSRCVAALQFHHVDPATKRFALSLKGVARSIDVVRAEAAKCVLLCANCHAEVEAGVSILPESSSLDRG